MRRCCIILYIDNQRVKMNPDYTSDIRLVERFIFEPSLYILQMFQKKLPSFLHGGKLRDNSKVFSQRLQAEDFDRDTKKLIGPTSTKPIWNCVTKVDCRVLHQRQNRIEHIPGIDERINQINQILSYFFERYQIEHQDESNLYVELVPQDLSGLAIRKNSQNLDAPFSRQYIKELFQILGEMVYRELNDEEEMGDSERMPPSDQTTMHFLSAARQILVAYINPEEKSDQNIRNFRQVLDQLNRTLVNNLTDVLQCKAGSLMICLTPKLMTLPLFIHPILISFYSLFRMQMNINSRKEADKKKDEGKDIDRPFGVFPNQTISRVVFINLDGYESEFNVDVAKFLSKSLMYVSFPQQSTNVDPKNQLGEWEDSRSARLLRKYFYQGLKPEEKEKLLSMFSESEREQKRNLFVLPIHSRKLRQLYSFQGVENVESAYISFMMKELIFSHILDFNPSCIVVSYSQKLRIEEEVFVDLMKELTVLANYKVVFYANLTKNYIFDETLPNSMNFSRDLMQKQKLYATVYEQSCQVILNDIPTTDLVEKMAMMMKISSGTFNLDKNSETNSELQKYKNYKAISYSTGLLKYLSLEYPTIARLKMLLADYELSSRAMKNYFYRPATFEKMFSKTIKGFHAALLKEVQTILQCDPKTITNPGFAHLRALADQSHPYKKMEAWMNFAFQYKTQVSTEKLESRRFFHLPRFQTKKKETKKQSTDNLISLEFDIMLQKQKIQAQFASCSKFYMQSIRNHEAALIYLTNHLPKLSSQQYMHFWGRITPEFDEKVDLRVELRQVKFMANPQLSQFETYTEFNYFQTNSYIFMFWPKIFDSRINLLSRFCNRKYTPKSTHLFFRAFRNLPSQFAPLQIQNLQQYQLVIPRHGCKCYEVQGTNTIYVMGGFYAEQQNYYKFQTDLTQFRYIANQSPEENPRAMIRNVPKQFYQRSEQGRKLNSFIRPRVEYEILQQTGEYNNEKTVFLIGGIGQKFVRPCSQITYLAQKMIFDTNNGEIKSSKRIRTHSLIPANVKGPLKSRNPSEMNLLTNAQNRKIYISPGEAGMNSQIISYHRVDVTPYEGEKGEEARLSFNYTTEYQFAEQDRKSYRDETVYLRKNLPENHLKSDVKAKCFRGRDFTMNRVAIEENGKKVMIALQLQLSTRVKSVHPNQPNTVKLTCENIISIDIRIPDVFAIVKHPLYTLGDCILAFFDLNELWGKTKEGKTPQIILKEYRKFDEDLSKHIVVVPKPSFIVIVHGTPLNSSETTLKEKILINTQKYRFKQFQIGRPNKEIAVLPQSNKVKGLSCSLFLNKDGVLFCFSFKSIGRNSNAEEVIFCKESLDYSNQKFQFVWKPQSFKKIEIVVQMQNCQRYRHEHLRLYDIKEGESGYTLVGSNDGCYVEGTLTEDTSILVLKGKQKSFDEFLNEAALDFKTTHSKLLQKKFFDPEELVGSRIGIHQ